MSAISNNHFSLDQQIDDAVSWINGGTSEAAFHREFPEWNSLIWSGSWVDTEESEVDVEYMAWVADWIERNTPVYWEDGEPWVDNAQSLSGDVS